MQPSSQVPFETHAAIYSVSLLIIFKLVKSLFSNIPKLFSNAIYQSFIIFLAGLCIKDKNLSAHGIAEYFGIKSHDALSHIFYHKCWSASLLMFELLNQAIQLSTTLNLPGWLIIDDVMLPKGRSFHTAGVYWDYDYVNDKYILCLRLVVIAWSNGFIRIPVAFAPYYKKGSLYLKTQNKKFRTKNQLAQTLVYRVLRKGLHFDYVTFDSWYASAENFNCFNRFNVIFIAALKSNRHIRWPFNPIENKPKRKCKDLKWHTLTCSEWAAERPYVRDYHYYKKLDARARQDLMFVKDVYVLLKVVCIKNYAKTNAFKDIHTKADKRAKDPNKYLVTNCIDLTIPQIVSYYRTRWTIEVILRDCKQQFGLGKCQAHKSMEPHLRYTAMGFLAFTLLELTKAKVNCSTIGDIKRYLQNQQLICLNGTFHIVDISTIKLNWDHVNYFSQVIDFNDINDRETQLVFNFNSV